MIGRNLSHYEVLEELGRGGMGVVYKARDTSLKRLVALKLLPPELVGNARRVALLRREAQASAALNHPRIVTIHAVEEAEGQLFLVMEHVEGETLDKAIPKGGFDLARFLKIAIPLADAVSAAHLAGIVHRDLKPHNILLTKADRPKILDFGLARLRPEEAPEVGHQDETVAAGGPQAAAESLSGALAGTVSYMSPEQLRCGPVDHRSDIFSLGIVFYEMATGRHPFHTRPGAVAESIQQETPDSVADLRPQLPRQLGRIIEHCLEKDPAERTQAAKDLCTDLEDLQRELANPPPRATPSPRRRRSALAALLAIAAVTAGGWWLRGRLDNPPTSTPYLTVEQSRIFPGESGPDYIRRGFNDSLRRRLTAMKGVFVLGERGPPPDLVLQADARRLGETVALAYRLRDAADTALGDGVFEGGAEELLELLERSVRSAARTLDRQPGVAVDYRPGRAPTLDPVAFDLYLQAEAAAEPSAGANDPEGARRLLDRALQRDPELALAHLLAGRLDLRQPGGEGAAAAERSCRAASELDPELGAAHSCLGEALILSDRPKEAVAPLSRAIELDPSDLTSRDRLRNAHHNLGLRGGAEATWRRLIDRQPDHWAGYFSLGRHYQDAERYEEALEQYDRALQLAPLDPDVQRHRGTVFFFLGRFEEAEVALRRSIEIRPSWDAYYNLGGLYFNLRRFAAAVAAYEQAVRLRPDDYRSQGRLGWACYWAPDRRQDAPPHLRRAIELADPNDPDGRILSALFHAMLGERERSLAALERALELEPDNSHYFYLAALAANHLGDTTAAIDWLRRAVRGGFSTAEIRTVIDLENLNGDPRFQQLLREADSTDSEAR